MVAEAAKAMSPSLIVHYVYDVAKAYNSFYHEVNILSGEPELMGYRLLLSRRTGEVIKEQLRLLGIEAPERM